MKGFTPLLRSAQQAVSLTSSARIASGTQVKRVSVTTPFTIRRTLAIPARPEPVRVRLPEGDTPGATGRAIPKWFKKEGDKVKAGEPLCEVDAGDVVYDFNSPVAGWVVRITAKEGSIDLKGGEVIAFMAGSQDEITSVAYEAAKEIAEHKVIEHGIPPEPAEPTPAKDDLSDWLKKIGGSDELLEYIPALKKDGFGSLEAMKTLEEADLEGLGITKRGHRKLISAGVASLKNSTASS